MKATPENPQGGRAAQWQGFRPETYPHTPLFASLIRHVLLDNMQGPALDGEWICRIHGNTSEALVQTRSSLCWTSSSRSEHRSCSAHAVRIPKNKPAVLSAIGLAVSYDPSIPF